MNKFVEAPDAAPLEPLAPAIGEAAVVEHPAHGGREKKKQFKRDKRDVHGWVVLDKRSA